MIRATTGGVLKGYRSNLMNSFINMNKARDTVLTQRNFNSYAEDPAAAAKAFRLRKSRMTVDSQHDICSNTLKKYQAGFSCLQSMDEVLDTRGAIDGSFMNTLHGATLAWLNDPNGDSREQLTKALDQMSQSLVQTMNQKYGDDFIFAGADGHNVPFEIRDNELYYRGVPVDSQDPGDIEKLKYLADEKQFVDIGLGFQENKDGKLIESSGFNAALNGINFFGYGVDKDGDPKNLYSLVQEMKKISDSVPEGGNWKDVYDDFDRLVKKFETACSSFKTEFVNMDAGTEKLKTNEKLLSDNFYNLQEQYADLEDVDMVDSITSFVWAEYCYNAALKVGNSVLSQSLMDYLS